MFYKTLIILLCITASITTHALSPKDQKRFENILRKHSFNEQEIKQIQDAYQVTTATRKDIVSTAESKLNFLYCITLDTVSSRVEEDIDQLKRLIDFSHQICDEFNKKHSCCW